MSQALQKAKDLINQYCLAEFHSEGNFTNLTAVGLAYTTITDDEIDIQVNADLENFRIDTYLNEHLVDRTQYETLDEMNEQALKNLNFDDLVYITDEQLELFEMLEKESHPSNYSNEDHTMMLNVPLMRKEPRIEFNTCAVEAVITLPRPQFVHFKNHLLDEYDFIRAHNAQMYCDREGIYHCLLVLCENENDGILVEAEGSSYARYSAIVPNARQLVMLEQFPGLTQLCENNPSEIENILRKNGSALEAPKQYRRLTDGDIQIMCAKHVLWLNDVGGEQADFSNCLLECQSLRGAQLENAIFTGATFIDVNMQHLSACFANFEGAQFEGCSLSDAIIEEANFQNAHFQSCSLYSAIFTHSDFTNAAIINSELSKVSLQSCCLQNTDFTGTDCSNINQRFVSWNRNEWLQDGEPIQTI